ncbi:acetyltransferase [Diplocarpon rosae]|nr:acetyltransferase [Diplocarpon rosae]
MPEAIPPAHGEVTLRQAQAEDVQAIIAIGTGVFAATFGYSLPPADLAEYLRTAYSTSTIAAEVCSPDIDTVVAVDPRGHVVGFCQLTRGTTEACLATSARPVELQRLYVAQDHHGRGVGRALVSRALDMARAQGFETVWLGVWEENRKAQRVYERLGFAKVGEHGFVMGRCVQTDWIMSMKL